MRGCWRQDTNSVICDHSPSVANTQFCAMGVGALPSRRGFILASHTKFRFAVSAVAMCHNNVRLREPWSCNQQYFAFQDYRHLKGFSTKVDSITSPAFVI